MNIEISASATDVAAWTGAITGICAFIFEIWRWASSGPKLKISGGPNRIVVGGYQKDNNSYVAFSASNIGNQSTTITNVCLAWYESRFKYLFSKPSMNAVVADHRYFDSPIPFIINPGNIWAGRFIQTEEIESWMNSGILVVEICDSVNKKSAILRLKGNEGKIKPS